MSAIHPEPVILSPKEKGRRRQHPFPLLPKIRRQNFTVPVTKTWRGLP